MESIEYKYAIYTILCVNDLARDSILSLKRYVEQKDKETKKIFGALLKRMNTYDKNIKNILGDEHGLRSIYNSFMDEEIDAYIEGLVNRINELYEENDVEDSEFLSLIEYSSICVHVANRVWEKMRSTLYWKGLHDEWLLEYKMDEICKISSNLSAWCYRKEQKKKKNLIHLGEDAILQYNLNAIFSVVANIDVFKQCYNKSKEERNKNYELYIC